MSSAEDDKLNSGLKSPRDQTRKDIIMGTAPRARDTRFQPGKSGNPNGRPRKAAREPLPVSAIPVLQAALHVASTPITITEAGVAKEIATGEAVIRSLTVAALKGNAYAAKKALELFVQAQARGAAETAPMRDYWMQYQEQCRISDEKAKREGRPPERHLPHPDDVIIEENGEVTCLGPINEMGQDKLDESLRFRDVYILQHTYDSRFGPRKTPDEPYQSAIWVYLIHLEKTLPPRVRLTEREWNIRFEAAARTPKQRLLKMLRRGWRSVGATYKRGFVFPARKWALETLEVQKECANLAIQHKSKSYDQFMNLPETIAVGQKLTASKARVRW